MMLAKLVKIKRYRIDIVVCLFNCVTDMENFTLKLWECVRCRSRRDPRVCSLKVFQALHRRGRAAGNLLEIGLDARVQPA